MELFTQATALAVAAVVILTELLKLVPVRFTTLYPAWVNGILSIVAAFIVVRPDFGTLTTVTAWLGTALLIAVVAAITYNQFTSKLKGSSTPPAE